MSTPGNLEIEVDLKNKDKIKNQEDLRSDGDFNFEDNLYIKNDLKMMIS